LVEIGNPGKKTEFVEGRCTFQERQKLLVSGEE